MDDAETTAIRHSAFEIAVAEIGKACLPIVDTSKDGTNRMSKKISKAQLKASYSALVPLNK